MSYSIGMSSGSLMVSFNSVYQPGRIRERPPQGIWLGRCPSREPQLLQAASDEMHRKQQETTGIGALLHALLPEASLRL